MKNTRHIHHSIDAMLLPAGVDRQTGLVRNDPLPTGAVYQMRAGSIIEENQTSLKTGQKTGFLHLFDHLKDRSDTDDYFVRRLARLH